ncbi:MAG TPA: hypothetical protein VMA73_08430 [Streptosporangiaceae bacterium]|nr:hypothetical protein [Streptosporangiaceae bacterium]
MNEAGVVANEVATVAANPSGSATRLTTASAANRRGMSPYASFIGVRVGPGRPR